MSTVVLLMIVGYWQKVICSKLSHYSGHECPKMLLAGQIATFADGAHEK